MAVTKKKAFLLYRKKSLDFVLFAEFYFVFQEAKN